MSPEVYAAIIKVAGAWAIELQKGLHPPKKDVEKELIAAFKRLLGQLVKIIEPPTTYSSVDELKKRT
jgi:hypothetical protein